MRLLLFTLLLISFSGISQLPSYVPTNGLQAWYSYSGNILDNSGNGHNNANYNIVSTADRFNNLLSALNFSGSGTEYLNYGDVDEFEPYLASFSFWINPEDYGSASSAQFKPIISKWADPTDLNGSTYNVYMNGTELCFIFTDGFTADTVTTSLSNIVLNQWSHIAITYSYGFTKIYINNVLVADASSAVSAFNNSDSDFKVGGWHQDINSNFSSFKGKIDDLGIWNVELDSCEVEALYAGIMCITADIEELQQSKKELIKVVDLMGREINPEKNKILIYIYSDGTTERVFELD